MKKHLLFLVLCMSVAVLGAQDIPPVTETVLLKNAVIVSAPGQVDSSASILFKEGIIQSVGSAVSAPYDARVVDADSLYIYPGFIAAASYAGVPKPKDDNRRPELERTGYPPNDVAGITPEKSLRDSYDGSNGSVSAMRKEGFTVSHSMPHGNMLPGSSAIISLNGESYDDAVIADEAATLLQMKGSGRMFPATEIGVMAKWRELYKNAEIGAKHLEMYNRNPLNKKRSEVSAAVKALYPVVNKSKTVFQPAEKHTHISRALQMQKEMGYDLVLAEVKQADMAIDMVKSAGVDMLLSLDLPEKIDTSKKKKKKDMPAFKVKEMEALTARKQAAIEKYVSAPASVAKAGIPFAFSYLEAKPKDIHKNIKRLIDEGGLSEQEALAALTTYPAKILNIDNVAGTLERGKLANMVVMTGPIFDKKSKIKMVIVDGVIHEYDVKEKAKKADGNLDITGEWSFVIEVPGMETSGTVKIIKNDDDTYKLTLANSASPGEEKEVDGVALDGNEMEYTYKVDTQGMTLTLVTNVVYEGETFEGTVETGQFGAFPVKGEKVSSPK